MRERIVGKALQKRASVCAYTYTHTRMRTRTRTRTHVNDVINLVNPLANRKTVLIFTPHFRPQICTSSYKM